MTLGQPILRYISPLLPAQKYSRSAIALALPTVVAELAALILVPNSFEASASILSALASVVSTQVSSTPSLTVIISAETVRLIGATDLTPLCHSSRSVPTSLIITEVASDVAVITLSYSLANDCLIAFAN